MDFNARRGMIILIILYFIYWNKIRLYRIDEIPSSDKWNYKCVEHNDYIIIIQKYFVPISSRHLYHIIGINHNIIWFTRTYTFFISHEEPCMHDKTIHELLYSYTTTYIYKCILYIVISVYDRISAGETHAR